MYRFGFSSPWVWALAFVLAVSSMRAQAQSLPSIPLKDKEARSWAAGVSAREQAIAREIHLAGNKEFVESRYAQALLKYKEAIRHWDHPAIRFNMAVALINLDRPVDAKDNLERSLLHGVAALGADAHGQALTYRKLLDAQLVHLTIACEEPGATVTLDGKFLFTGPGNTQEIALPGEHQVVTTKAGFVTSSETFTLVAGRSYEIKPVVKLASELKALAAGEPCKDDRAARPYVPYTPTLKSAARVAATPVHPGAVIPAPYTPPTTGTIYRSPLTNTAPQGGLPAVPSLPVPAENTESTFALLVKSAMTPTPPGQSTTLPPGSPTSMSQGALLEPPSPYPPQPPILTPPMPTPLLTPTYQPRMPTYQPPMHQPPMHQPPMHQPHMPSVPAPHSTHQPPMPSVPNPTPTAQPPTPTYRPPAAMPQPSMPTIPTPRMPYQPPTATYRPPTPTYQPPTPTYRPPTPTYQPPTPTYRPPTPTYQPPTPTYRPPTPTYQPPTPTYRPPTPTYQPPTYRR
jgi:PEGA domain